MPDILLVDEKMPLQSYIAKGLLADVGKLLEEDGELDSGQFMENVLDAFRVNGTLYYVVPSFSVDTLVTKQSGVGNKSGWNQEEFSAVMAGLPQGAEMIFETTFVPPMTQEQIDRAVDIMEGLHNPAFEDGVIMNIIYEEADSFFQGQKTAGEVAALIQSSTISNIQ